MVQTKWRRLDAESQKRREEAQQEEVSVPPVPSLLTSDPRSSIHPPDLFFCYITCRSYTCVMQSNSRGRAGDGRCRHQRLHPITVWRRWRCREAQIADWYSTWYSNTQHSRNQLVWRNIKNRAGTELTPPLLLLFFSSITTFWGPSCGMSSSQAHGCKWVMKKKWWWGWGKSERASERVREPQRKITESRHAGQHHHRLSKITFWHVNT